MRPRQQIFAQCNWCHDLIISFATVHLKQELELLLQRPIDLARFHKRMNTSLRAAILQEGVTA
ncbi:hypothetical protein AAF134_11155 [Synechococcus lacustris Tous-12m]